MSAPRREDLRELVELGQFLDAVIELDGVEQEITGRRSRLLWSPRARAAVVFGSAYKLGRPRKVAPDALPARAADVYAEWTRGREATQLREATIELPRGRFADLGRALTIGYRSDKFHRRGETVDYQHEFEAGVHAYQLGADAGAVLVFRGGRLRLTSDGLEG